MNGLNSSISDFAAELGRLYSPERVLLFGSQAIDQAGRSSDVDILVVLEHAGNNPEMAASILCALDPAFPIDLLVRTPIQVRELLSLGDPFFEEIFTSGKVLYESARRGMA